ncbi:hypothetical protein NFI96_029728 [Prochilodus magdalenae]|nr:hypothetical protein NFI96_029728 [Prochilodus magdalenae]
MGRGREDQDRGCWQGSVKKEVGKMLHGCEMLRPGVTPPLPLPHHLQELCENIPAVWDGLPQDTIRNLYSSMLRYSDTLKAYADDPKHYDHPPNIQVPSIQLQPGGAWTVQDPQDALWYLASMSYKKKGGASVDQTCRSTSHRCWIGSRSGEYEGQGNIPKQCVQCGAKRLHVWHMSGLLSRPSFLPGVHPGAITSPEPRWASINRGVLICDECCSIHRGLGRHSSQVRHLTHTAWPPSQLQMVQTLYNNGANSIWEHSLLDPSSIMSGKRKANPQDRVHPNKTEFIKAKYQMLAFVHRMPCREDDSVTAKDLSKQLHSSVRTGNLETCLRLLSLGAQANFFHPEKGNTPLHVAAKAGQVLQAELLTVYGADPGAPDSSGNTPIDYARQAGHQELADRLVEIQYELTDRLAFYLCGRRPDHKNGQHFIIPQIADSSLDLSELAKAAKKKLQSLSNHQFEELAMDVYDEVDRRETDAVWLATQNHSTLVTETTVVPFLPVNPEYSSTRNQGRQKLARFNAHEFATLVIDILTDAKRRQQGSSPDNVKDNVELILKDIGSRHGSESQELDQPDYDSVASDEDTEHEPASGKDERTKSSESSDLSDGPITVQEFMEVKSALNASEAKIQQLLKVNCHLRREAELRIMQSKVLNSLQSENTNLKWPGPNSLAHPQDPQRRVAPRGGPGHVHVRDRTSGLLLKRHYHPRADGLPS